MTQPALQFEVLTRPADWAALRPDWNRLYAACPDAGPPLHPAWLTAWWEVYGPAYAAADGLRIAIARRDGELVAGAPLYLSQRRGRLKLQSLRPLSTGEAEAEETCADYLDPLALPDCREPFLASLADAVQSGRCGAYDRFIWPSVVDPQPLTAAFDAASESEGDCYLLDLTDGYEAYLMRLSRETRRKTRRLLKELAANQLEFQIAGDRATAEAMFNELVALHQVRWQQAGQPGCYASPRFTAFHRRLVAELQPRTELVLASLRDKDRTLAVIQGFRHGPKLDFYQSGVVLDAGEASRNAGVTCYLACLRELAESGVETADFLLGDAIYKQRQSTARRPLWQVSAPGRSVRGRLAAWWKRSRSAG